MREQLIQYVDLLFAGAADAEDIKQEILTNTLDRYDDLVSQGKSAEAAYSLAISGIGDVSELLSNNTATVSVKPAEPVYTNPTQHFSSEDNAAPTRKKYMRAVAIALYICCVVPIIVLSPIGYETIGVCLMFLLIAAATALLIIAGGNEAEEKKEEPENLTPTQELHKAIKSVSGIATLCIYLFVSFATGAWWVTWLIFPISGAVQGLIKACIDLKEAQNHEN